MVQFARAYGRFSIALLLASVALVPRAHARSAGIASVDFAVPALGCHNCHFANPGTAPTVSLAADRTALAAGQAVTLTFVVTSMAPAQTHAGFNLRASQ